jgi:CBS domain-containing protein
VASIHNPLVDRAKDAMVSDPPMLDGDSSAQEAGEALSRPEVRAVFVSDHGLLLGVVTRKTLVREVVAAGRDPRGTTLREIAEVPLNTIGSDLPLDEAFRFLEDQDLDRVPVLEDGRLVGVLSRAVLQRRLAEDEPPDENEL